MNFPSHRKVSKAFEEALQDVTRHASNGAAEGRRIDRGPGGVKMVFTTLYKLASVPHLGNCISTYQYVIEQCLQPYSISRSSSSQLSSEVFPSLSSSAACDGPAMAASPIARLSW